LFASVEVVEKVEALTPQIVARWLEIMGEPVEVVVTTAFEGFSLRYQIQAPSLWALLEQQELITPLIQLRQQMEVTVEFRRLTEPLVEPPEAKAENEHSQTH
jgi:hypothetical protein